MSIQYESLHDSRPDDTFSSDVPKISIFSKFCSRPWIQILGVQCCSLGHPESFGSFQDVVAQFPIFSRLSTRAHMSVMIAYSNPLRKD
jgi:hypothetical protein